MIQRYRLTRVPKLNATKPSASEQYVGAGVILPGRKDFFERQLLREINVLSVAHGRTAQQDYRSPAECAARSPGPSWPIATVPPPLVCRRSYSAAEPALLVVVKFVYRLGLDENA
jgi:hypothetical protein